MVSKKVKPPVTRGQNPQKNKKKAEAAKKKRSRPSYIQYDLRDMQQFSLCDAMR